MNTMTTTTTFFDTLPTDELVCVVRQYAKRDTDNENNQHKLLFPSKSAFKRALPSCFTKLRISTSTSCDVMKKEIKLNPYEETLDIMRVFQSCGRVFDTIIFGNFIHTKEECRVEIERVISECVRMGAEIVIAHAIASSQHRNYSYEHRVISGMRHVGGKVHLMGSKSTFMQGLSHWCGLKKFYWRGNCPSVLNDLWRHVGNTIEEVKLLCPVYSGDEEKSWLNCLHQLQTHCRALSHIKLQDPLDDSNVTEEFFSRFLMSYGDQLKYVMFYSTTLLSDKFYRDVATACTNLRCVLEEDENRFSRIAALNNSIADLILTLHDMSDTDEFTYTMSQCQHLLTLCLLPRTSNNTPINDTYINAIFGKTKYHSLQNLDIHCALNTSSLRHIARGTTNLRSVNLKFLTLTPPHTSQLRDFAVANPLLRHVTIVEEMSSPNVVSVIDGVSHVFQECCELLQRVRFYFYSTPFPSDGEQLRDVCSKYRLRLFNIKISFRDITFAPYQTLVNDFSDESNW